MEPLEQEQVKTNKTKSYVIMLLALLLFIFAIDLLIVAMSHLNNAVAEDILLATKNPFVSLFIGLLVTALIQSSSTVTASIVAMVASGNLALEQAVPMVMGANIGTTLTSTLVALSFIMDPKAFKRAFSAGMLHDIFNIFSVIILLPLELQFKFLSKIATRIADLFVSDPTYSGSLVSNKVFTRPVTEWISETINIPFITMIISVFLVFGAIKLLSNSVYKAFLNNNFQDINKLIFKNPYMAAVYGTFFTAAVQSSTVTTSLIVPLVANKKVSVKKSFPFIIGANIGTTITAALAAIYKIEAAIALALVHFLFNVIGALIFLPFPTLRSLPVKLALKMGKATVKNKLIGFAYILLTFFIIPFLLIYFSNN